MFKTWLKTEESKPCITELWIIMNVSAIEKNDTDNDTALYLLSL